MRIVTEGIVLKETKLTDGRRILHIFTEKYGKISAGTSINEKGKSKSALALKPFTVAVYSLYKNRDSFTVSSSEVKHTYYKLGEDIDRYVAASIILELTEKVLEEGQSAPSLFRLLLEVFEELELRNKKYDTIVLSFQVKLLKMLGIMPHLEGCGECGSTQKLDFFSVSDGYAVCSSCEATRKSVGNTSSILLSDELKDALLYFENRPLRDFRTLALNDKISDEMKNFIRRYIKFHLDIGNLKSESLMNINIGG